MESKDKLLNLNGRLRSPSKKAQEGGSPEKIKNKSKRVLLDILVCNAFINFEWQEWDVAKQQFEEAQKVSWYC